MWRSFECEIEIASVMAACWAINMILLHFGMKSRELQILKQLQQLVSGCARKLGLVLRSM